MTDLESRTKINPRFQDKGTVFLWCDNSADSSGLKRTLVDKGYELSVFSTDEREPIAKYRGGSIKGYEGIRATLT